MFQMSPHAPEVWTAHALWLPCRPVDERLYSVFQTLENLITLRGGQLHNFLLLLEERKPGNLAVGAIIGINLLSLNGTVLFRWAVLVTDESPLHIKIKCWRMVADCI